MAFAASAAPVRRACARRRGLGTVPPTPGLFSFTFRFVFGWGSSTTLCFGFFFGGVWAAP